MLYFCALSNVYVAYAMCILQKSQNLFRSKTTKSQNLYFFNTFPNKVFIIKLKILIFLFFIINPKGFNEAYLS